MTGLKSSLYAKALLKTVLFTAAAFAAFNVVSTAQPYSVVYNRTASIPLGIYLIEEVNPSQLKVGDIGCFEYTAPEWAKDRQYFPPGFRLCKPIFAQAGTMVGRKEGKLLVGKDEASLEVVASFTDKDGGGRPLKQDALPAEGVVPEGHWLMLAKTHSNSFDSRYLGFLPMRAVRYKAIPLVTW